MKRILCPIDFSPSAMNACEYAFHMAQNLGADLLLLHAIHPHPADLTGQKSLSQKVEALHETMSVISDACHYKAKYPEVTYSFMTRTGFAGDIIPDLIKEEHIDLVIMGTGSGAGSISFFGTLSAQIAERSICPVLIIPERCFYQEMHHVIFAQRVKENDYGLIHYIIKLTHHDQPHIYLVNVFDKLTDHVEDIVVTEQKIQEEFPDGKVTYHIVENNNIIQGISDFAKHRNANMIVMCSSHRSKLLQLIAIGHSSQMAYQTKMPLLILHHASYTDQF